MYTFKEIDNNSTVLEHNAVNYTHDFSNSTPGVNYIKIVSGSSNNNYWNSLNVLFYTSGSPNYINENKFSTMNFSIKQPKGTQHLNKFHGYDTISLFTFPQSYYGEKIKEGSFILRDSSHPSGTIVIQDDKFGNLYSTNAHHSQSTNNASHSDNYVGNIFYDHGIAVITETGSWSGSVKYTDIGTTFTTKFDSHHEISTYEYSVTLQPQEFNKSMNYSLRMPLSGSYTNLSELTSSIISNPYLATEFTGSAFSPYITTINLYQNGDHDTPAIIAHLPKPIKKSKKISTTFKIRLDI